MSEAAELRDAIRRQRDVLIGVLPGIAVCALHATMLLVPKADFIDALDSDRYRIQWITGSYILGTAAGMALTRFACGWLGMRWAYLIGAACFALAGAACGLVHDVPMMAPLRFIQGHGHGQMISIGMVLIWRTFPADKALPMALYGLAIYLPAVLGATLGGWMTVVASWRLIFFSLLPLGAFAFLAAWRWVPPDGVKPPATPFDAVGFFFLLSWIATMSVVLDMGQYWGWFDSPAFVAWFAGFVLCFGGFIGWGIFSPHPLIDLRILARRNFTLGMAIKSLFSVNLAALLALLAGYMINLRGYQWQQAGVIFLPAALMMGLGVGIGAVVGTPCNRRLRMIGGLLVMTASTAAFASVDLYTSKILIATCLGVWGAGAGFVIAPALLTTFEGLPHEDVVRTAGVFNILRTLPAFVGGAALSILLTRATDARFDTLRQNIRYNRPVVEQALRQPEDRFVRSVGAVPKQAHAFLGRWVHANSKAFAFQDVFGWLALAPASAAALAFAVRPRSAKS